MSLFLPSTKTKPHTIMGSTAFRDLVKPCAWPCDHVMECCSQCPLIFLKLPKAKVTHTFDMWGIMTSWLGSTVRPIWLCRCCITTIRSRGSSRRSSRHNSRCRCSIGCTCTCLNRTSPAFMISKLGFSLCKHGLPCLPASRGRLAVGHDSRQACDSPFDQ